VTTEHRSATKGFYDKLQLPENSEAREFLEELLDTKTLVYEEICLRCKASTLFEDLKIPTPQDLSRYRQRRARELERQNLRALIEADAQVIIDGAAKNPNGVLATHLRRQLAQHAIVRFDAEIDLLDPVQVSKETARQALVEQRDRKLDLDTEKLRLENKRLELQERQAELARDKFGIAAKSWQFILGWFVQRRSPVADAMTAASESLLGDLEIYIESEEI
jgi:hypothetical protein